MPKPESPLSYLGFQLIAPGPRLRPYVREYWAFRRDTPLTTYHDEYMHPRGGYGIVFNFGSTLRLDGERALADPVFLDGTNTVSRSLGFLGRIDLLGASFHEGGAYPFLGIPLNALRNETALLDAFDRTELLRLHAWLEEAGSLQARINLLEDWLIGRLALGKERSVLVPATLAKLRQLSGCITIPEVVREFSISQRQLERLYQVQVGMSPKQYARLLWIEAARSALKQMSKPATASLAADLGFYDQAHFIREFCAVVGITPYAYLQRRRPK